METATASSLITSPTSSASACLFRCQQQQLALDVRAVSESVVIERLTSLPRLAPAILGMSNLRGAPLPIVDLAQLLALDPSRARPPLTVLILRHRDLFAALVVDAVLRVQPYAPASLLPFAEDPGGLGDRLLPDAPAGESIRMLDPDRLHAALHAISPREYTP